MGVECEAVGFSKLTIRVRCPALGLGVLTVYKGGKMAYANFILHFSLGLYFTSDQVFNELFIIYLFIYPPGHSRVCVCV